MGSSGISGDESNFIVGTGGGEKNDGSWAAKILAVLIIGRYGS